MRILRFLVSATRHLPLQQPVMRTLVRLVADTVAVLLMAATALLAWAVVQVGGGGALLASLLAFPACALMAAAIDHVQRWRSRR